MQPLEGVRIADFSHVIAGPLATQFLCLLGAEVIKIEPPQGDAMRYYTPRNDLRGMAEPFIGANAGKKSVVLDLKTEAGRAAARAIALSSDILVENFRPGVAARLGLAPENLHAEKPSLIFASISGFGQSGPMRDYPAIDQIIQAMSGLKTLSGEPGAAPMRIGFPVVDTYSALLSAFAIMGAYLQRLRAPETANQRIDVSMLDAAMVLMSSVVNPMLISGTLPQRSGNRGFSGAPTADTFRTADGEITIGAVQQVQVERLFRALGLSELLSDERFATPDARLRNDAALQERLSAVFATRRADEWEQLLAAEGVPAGFVRDAQAAIGLSQLKDRNLLLDVTTPADAVPTARILNAGFLYSVDGPGHNRPPPALGEHTEEVLGALGIEIPTDF